MTRGREPAAPSMLEWDKAATRFILRSQGWPVTGFDTSTEGVRLARAEAARPGLQLSALVATVDQFDSIDRAEDPHLDTKRIWPEGGLLRDNELPSLFPGLRVISYEDVWAVPDWQAMGLKERLMRLCAEKPRASNPGCIWEGNTISQGGTVCWDKSVKFRCEMDGWLFTREKCER